MTSMSNVLRLALCALLLLCLAACGDAPDETAPELTLDRESFTTPTAETEVTLSGTIEGGASLEVEVSAEMADVISSVTENTWSATVTALAEGSNTIDITATDDTGNLKVIRTFVVVDTTAPSVSSSDPADGAVEVSVDTVISVTFSEPVSPETVTEDTFFITDSQGQPVPGERASSPETDSVTFILTPAEPLSSQETYTATVAQVADPLGNTLETETWTFTTGAASAP